MSEYYRSTQDLRDRFEELKNDKQALADEVSECADDPEHGDIEKARRELDDWKTENDVELKELAEIVKGLYDGDEDEQLVADEDFAQHARDVAEDLYNIEPHWPFSHIDWDKAADDLKLDYTSFEFEGTTYWYRCH